MTGTGAFRAWGLIFTGIALVGLTNACGKDEGGDADDGAAAGAAGESHSGDGDGDSGDGDGDGDTGDGDGDGDSGDGDGATRIGPKGGTVVSDDGELTLTIPEGALDETHPIRIARTSAEDAQPLGEQDFFRIYALEPDRLTFDKAVEASIHLAHPVEQEGSTVRSEWRRLWLESDGEVELLVGQGLVIDSETEEAQLTGTLDHFSLLAVGEADRNFGNDVAFAVDHPESLCLGEAGTVEVSLKGWGEEARIPVGDDGFIQTTFPVDPPPRWVDLGSADPESSTFSGSFARGLSNTMEETITESFELVCDGGAGPVTRTIEARVPTSLTVNGMHTSTQDEQRLSLTYTIECEVCEEPDDLSPGTTDTLAGPETVVRIPGGFAQIDSPHLLVAGEGTVIQDDEGNRLYDFESEGSQVYKAEPITWQLEGQVGESIFGIGPEGFFDRAFSEDQGSFSQFAYLGAMGQNITAFHSIGAMDDPALTAWILLVSNTTGDALSFRPTEGLDETPVLSSTELSMAGIPGKLVDLIPTSESSSFFGTTNEQPFVVVGSTITAVGDSDMNGGYRLVDCDGPLCAVSNYGRGEVSTLYLDGSGQPDTAVDVQDVDGPVAVDVYGDRVVAAGYSDHTLVLIEASMSGESSVSSLDVSDVCQNPSAPRFTMTEDGGLQVLTNCYGSAQVYITEVDPF